MTTVYAAMRDAFLTIDPDEERCVESLTDHDGVCVAASSDAPDRVLCGTADAGLHRSEDGGRSFERVGDATLGSEHVTSAAVSPHDPEEVWVGTEPSAVYRSLDGGDSWERREGITDLPSEPEWYFPPRPDTHHVRWIELDPHEPGRLYVGIELGALIISDDAGETWRERPEGSRRDNHSLATHSDTPGRVYSAAGDGYAESTDGGESWTRPQKGLEHRYCWSVAPDPGDPDTVLLSSASGARTAHTAGTAESYVYRRTERNGRWERLEGLPTGEGVLRAELESAGSGAFYAVNNRGLYRTDDVGDSWERIDVDWEAYTERAPWGLAVVFSSV
ncbi:WD40/YVTN/BNR-like repeat-containing protein [Halalkalicoccus salilacus]|uniref:WD40/YVTN/BNR-like repeat-containing protein n=2 Tax=Halococcaceae TaxID=1963270 RepID=UPI0036125541